MVEDATGAEDGPEQASGQVEEATTGSQQVTVVETTVEVQPVTTVESSSAALVPVEDLAVGDSLNELLGLQKITFDHTHRLNEQGIAEMTRLLEFLLANPQIDVNVRAHTFWFAPGLTPEDQVGFSELQARHVGLYLTNSGIESDRVTTEAIGSAEMLIAPLDTTGTLPDMTDEQRSHQLEALDANNRIEVIVTAL